MPDCQERPNLYPEMVMENKKILEVLRKQQRTSRL